MTTIIFFFFLSSSNYSSLCYTILFFFFSPPSRFKGANGLWSLVLNFSFFHSQRGISTLKPLSVLWWIVLFNLLKTKSRLQALTFPEIHLAMSFLSVTSQLQHNPGLAIPFRTLVEMKQEAKYLGLQQLSDSSFQLGVYIPSTILRDPFSP